MPAMPKRRAHYVLGSVEARLVVVVDREEEVLRTRLGVRGQTAVAEEPHLLQSLRRGKVNDVERDAAGHLRETEGAICRLALGLGRPRQRMPLRLRVLRRERAF